MSFFSGSAVQIYPNGKGSASRIIVFVQIISVSGKLKEGVSLTSTKTSSSFSQPRLSSTIRVYKVLESGKNDGLGLNTSDEKDLKVWLKASEENRFYFQEVVAIWKNAARPEESVSLNEMEDKVLKVIKREIAPVSTFKWIRYAAAILLLGVALITFRLMRSVPEVDPILLSTSEGERLEFVLPDSSLIWMNENSELSFVMEGNSRKVRMSGEIFFDIWTDSTRSFIIEAGKSRTEVLGTSFNIKTEEDGEVEIRVSSGVVAFSAQSNEQNRLELEKGELAILSSEEEELTKEETAVLNTAVWRTGELNFDNNELGMLADELRRYMDLDLRFEDPAIANCKVTAVIALDDKSLVEDILSFSMGLEIEKTDERTWVLKGESCE